MRVGRTVAALAVASLLVIPITACDSNPVAPDRSQWLVTYSLTISGGQSAVSTLTYRAPNGPVSVNNPADGWSTEFWTYAGMTVGMTARGTVRDGTIEISWRGVKGSGTNSREVFGTDSCSAQGTAQSCSLQIAEYTL